MELNTLYPMDPYGWSWKSVNIQQPGLPCQQCFSTLSIGAHHDKSRQCRAQALPKDGRQGPRGQHTLARHAAEMLKQKSW